MPNSPQADDKLAQDEQALAPDSRAVDPNADEGWVLLAWRAWLHGARNWTALGKQFGKKRDTVRVRVTEYSKQVAAAYAEGSVDALSEYVEGLYEDLRDADTLHREARNENIKLGAVNRRTETRKLIAAAKGVVTERKAHELTGTDGAPIVYEVVIGGAPQDEEQDGSAAAGPT